MMVPFNHYGCKITVPARYIGTSEILVLSQRDHQYAESDDDNLFHIHLYCVSPCVCGCIFAPVLCALSISRLLVSIAAGSANLSGKAQGKMALLTLSIFMLTSLISALIGLCFVTAIYPGRDMSGLVGEDTSRQQSQKTPTLTDTFLDLIRYKRVA